MKENEIKEQNVIKATGIDGCNVLIFDGKSFADSVAENVERLAKSGLTQDIDITKEYLKAMQGLTVKIENCTATFDNSSKKD